MEDFNLKAGAPVINSEIDLIWQQVDLLFDAEPGLLHGDIDYGTDYEHLLYELNLSPSDLEFKMRQDLEQLDLHGYQPHVKAYLLKGTQRDIALIQVDLVKNKTYSKIYKIT